MSRVCHALASAGALLLPALGAPPGIGLPPIPSLGEASRPVRHVAVFGLDGTPAGSAKFVRADLYRGQTCAFTGQPFVLRALIGYYECFNAAG